MAGLAHHQTIYIRCRPAELWAALTEGEQTKRWFFGTTIESSLEVGAPIRYLAHRDETAIERDGGGDQVDAIRGTVRVVEPQRRLVYELRFCDLDDPASELEWTLSEPAHAIGVVRLDIDHRELVADSETWRRTSAGWPVILSALKTWLETSTPLEITSA